MAAFDVFLSHNSLDKPWVAKLKDDLIRYGLKVWLDRDEIRPGTLFAKALEDALGECGAVALIISPEAMASGWVEEEYSHALSLTKKTQPPVQLIPVILRSVEVPGFVQSRNSIDFRDESRYDESVWRLVWGITGQKPQRKIDLAAPSVGSSSDGRDLVQKTIQKAETSNVLPLSSDPAGLRTGGIKAGGRIKAKNIVDGVQIKGGNEKLAREMLELAKGLQTGGISAEKDIIAENILTGFQYLGQGGTTDREQFRKELAALREQLCRAIKDGEIADPYDAQDAETAVERAAEQADAEPAAKDRIAGQLDRAGRILTRAAETAVAARKFGAAVIKLAPVVNGLRRMVEILF